jgi:hypothetical protein
MGKICLVACSRLKRGHATKAKYLYSSPLFIKSSEFAQKNFDSWYILSAKYSLLEPEQIIEPYDLTLKNISHSNKKIWANLVFEQLQKVSNPGDVITFLAGSHYYEYLAPMLSEKGYEVNIPLKGFSIGKQLNWLNKVNTSSNQILHLDEFYSLLKKLETGFGGRRIFKYSNGKLHWPQKGVYFLFSPNEFRTLDRSTPRVVRVGTHAVSAGSKSTLWNRLRAHRGSINGQGNHRASIFRLHVGSALIERSAGKINLPSWGHEQWAPTEIRNYEINLEKQVSDYIGDMSTLWLSVEDESGPRSDRAFIERNAIALLVNSGNIIDLPSKDWLGNFSPHMAIRRSGLWNVDYIDNIYDQRFLEIIAEYVDITIGTKPKPNQSIAPRDWNSNQANYSESKQLFLLEKEDDS